MIQQGTIEGIVKEELNPETEFIVDISVTSGNKITVLLDGEEGITINRCVQISRAIEQSFDRDEEDFELEVSSAGLSTPLKLYRQFAKNIGRDVDVVMLTGEKYTGRLTLANESLFTIEFEEIVKVEGKKRKQRVERTLEIPYTDTKSVLVSVSFR
ncbi:MAG: ribosome assembly cofactor RimP [Bacteroidales bacterium]